MRKASANNQVVGFGLESLLIEGAPGFQSDKKTVQTVEMSPGAANVLETVHRVGATSLVLTHLHQERAIDLLGQAGLQATEVHGGLDEHEQAALLSGVNTWTYITRSARHVRAVHEVGIKTTGLATSKKTTDKIWRAGADLVVHDLQDFAGLIKLPWKSTPALLSHSAAGQALGVATETVRHWSAQGNLPYLEDITGTRRFPRAFIDRLRWFTREKPPTIFETKLLKLEWDLKRDC